MTTGHGPPRYDTTTVTVRVRGPMAIASPQGDHAAVSSVSVSVAGADSEGTHQDPLAEADLALSAGVWTATLSDLTIGTELTFTAQALDANDVTIFSGTHTATLASAGEQVTIGLSVVDDGTANRFPTVTGITVDAVTPSGTATVEISVKGSANEELNYDLSDGTFTPSSGTITLSNAGTGTITSSYEAPSVAGRYIARVAVENAQGHRTETDFRITVAEASPASHTISANLGPVVQSLTGRRTPAGVRWTATLSAAGDGTGLTFAWTFTGTETFVDAAANPAMLSDYDESTTGTLEVTVTDAAALSTSASLALTTGMFPDALQPQAAELVINEIDFDQAGVDTAELVEIWNPGSSAVTLDGYRIDLVNGSDNLAYASYTGSGDLTGGGFLVIADQGVIDALPAEATSVLLKASGVQNGPDGIRIVEVATGRVVDGVHYKGRVPGCGEGSPAPPDPATASTSIGRCPDGFDSDDNGLDFASMTATPGATNTCS